MTTGHRRILIAGQTSRRIARLMRLGRLLAGPEPGVLQLAGLVAVPPDKSLSTGALGARGLRSRLEPLAREAGAGWQVMVAHDISAELRAVAKGEADCLTLLDWRSKFLQGSLRDLPGDVAIFKGRVPPKITRILLPIRGGPHAELALRLALAVCEAQGAQITLLHAMPPRRRDEAGYRTFLNHLRALPAVTRWVNVQASDVVEAIAREAAHHQLVVMGAVALPEAQQSAVGPIAQRVGETLSLPLLVVRSSRPAARERADSPPIDHTISVVVDKWFAENSFHASEFSDLSQLAALKEKQGLTISVGLPALNEAATIGPIIRTIQKTLMRDVPLVDELVVMDSLSTDRTVEIAQALDVPVHVHSQVLPEQGAQRGKGEALWKSLAVLKGDLIAWVDTDIENFHPRFVYGVLGPLIRNPRLMYTKGYYHRPLKVGGRLVEGGGGRVTELVARPLLNLFFPELSGMVQPLSGEYAGRRQALMQVPFFAGYGVETGLLIDILLKFGLDAIGQVDLEQRVHRSQPLEALSRMAFAIIQVVMQRVSDQHQIALMEAMNQSLKQILYDEQQFALDVQPIRDVERPPMGTVLTAESNVLVPG